GDATRGGDDAQAVVAPYRFSAAGRAVSRIAAVSPIGAVSGIRASWRLRLDEEGGEDARQRAAPAAADDEIGQDFVGDRGILDEAVPGALQEARRVDVLAVRQRHQLGVADETNEGAHDERLQRRVVVDLGDDDAPDSGDDARPRARG